MVAMVQSQLDREIQMYGCSIADFKESLEDSITFQTAGLGMCIASMLSDAQEEMAHGMNEQARHTLNRAKWAISHYQLGRK